MAAAPLHPHSTTHSQNGSPLPALQHHMAMRGSGGGQSGGGGVGSSRSLESQLCFSPRELGARGTFDAHAFVSKCLASPNPALMGASDDPEAAADAAVSTQAAALLQREAAADGPLITMPEHSASPSLPLELLREHLTRYQLYVKGELVELLNAEYARFIGLSSSLSGLDHSIGAIESQLAALAREVNALHQRLHTDALAPFQHKLLAQHAHEKNKQTYLHMVAHVLAQVKSLAVLVANQDDGEGVEEEAERGGKDKHIESKQKEQTDGALTGAAAATPAQQRLVAHHLSASHARHQQRAAELKQQRRANAARGLESSGSSGGARRSGGGQHAQGAYADLKLDIPPWMLRQYGGHGAAAADIDAESDFDDDEGGEDASDEEEDGVEAADEDGADAFGLYQALLLSHPSAPADSPPASPASPALAALRARLVRVERASVALSSLRALLPLCAHFHVVRDLCASDGVSGPFDTLASKVRDQSRACFVAILEQLGDEYEKQLPGESDGSTAAAASPLPEAQFSPALVSLLRSSLRALTFLDVRTEAEEMVRTTLVRPVLRRRVQAAMPALRAAHAMDEDQYWAAYGDAAEAGQAPSTPHPLRALYAHLLHFLRGPVRLLMEACAGDDAVAVAALSASSLQSGCVASAAAASPAFPSPSAGRAAPLLPFSFLSASFFAEVVSFLSTEVGSVLFSSGLPHVFLAHFHATKSFLAAVDSFAAAQLDPPLPATTAPAAATAVAGSPSVAALHAHPSWVAFDKRWNVGIYFQLRFQTIAAGLESAVVKVAPSSSGGAGTLAQLAAGKAVPSAMPEPLGDSCAPFAAVQSCEQCFHMGVSSALWRSLCACFSPRTFLSEAAPRFLKLALQCLARWATWAEEAAKAAGAATHAGGTAGLGSLQAPEAQLLLLVADVQRILQLLPTHLLPLVARVLGVAAVSPLRVQAALRSGSQQGGESSEDEALLRAICGAFSPSLGRLSALSDSASGQLGDLLLSRCTPALSYVSRIKPAYRFSRQPTHALQYVRAMLQPVTRAAHAIDAGDVRPLLGSGGDGGAAGGGSGGGAGGEMDVNEGMADDATDTAPLPPPSLAAACGPLLGADARAALLRDVLGRLSVAYAAEAAKVLSGDIFGELSKKLNKRTAAAAGGAGIGAGAGSEVDKTRRQLHLDATLFARIVREQIAARDADDIIQPLMQATQLNA